jgi:catechol 2,3-dioxygenase-like lactoylglutathione lyase family enzyme
MFGYLVRGSVDRQGKDGDARTLGACVSFGLRDNPLKETGHLGGKGTPMIDHTGVIVADLEKSKKFYSSALGAGGRDNSVPGLRPHYHPNYYGAFVFDPDGHNIEAVCREPA